MQEIIEISQQYLCPFRFICASFRNKCHQQIILFLSHQWIYGKWKETADGFPSFDTKTGKLCKACKISVSSGVFIQSRELVGAATHLIHLQKKQTSHKERCQNGSESITTAEQLEPPLACQSRDHWGENTAKISGKS